MRTPSSAIGPGLIAIAIMILGFTLKSGIDNFVNSNRQVTVRGLCEKEVKANKVTWPIVTKEVGNDLGTIYNKIQNTNTAIVNFLKENGISEAEISTNPPEVTDVAADRYSYNSTIPYRYQVTNTLVVTSDKVDQIQQLMTRQTELMRQGIAIVAGGYDNQVHYEYTDLNSIKPDMIAEATAAAREAANKFAEDSHSDLGKIRTASQGQFSISDRDQYTPQIKTIRVVTYITYALKD